MEAQRHKIKIQSRTGATKRDSDIWSPSQWCEVYAGDDRRWWKAYLRQLYGNFDGKDYPFTGSGTIDTIAITRSGNTFESTFKKGGKVVGTGKNTVAKDGKVMTYTPKGTNASGQPTSNVIVYDKQ
jgi:hypothetical protein